MPVLVERGFIVRDLAVPCIGGSAGCEGDQYEGSTNMLVALCCVLCFVYYKRRSFKSRALAPTDKS